MRKLTEDEQNALWWRKLDLESEITRRAGQDPAWTQQLDTYHYTNGLEGIVVAHIWRLRLDHLCAGRLDALEEIIRNHSDPLVIVSLVDPEGWKFHLDWISR